MELNFEDLEMQRWNIQTDVAQRIDEKNWVIFLFIIFTPRLMVIKMSKKAIFVLSADDSKKMVTVSAKYLSACERSI